MELIEKGLKLLYEEGYEEFSLRKVAKACNVSHAAHYRHFRNKDELIAAIGTEAMHRFSQSLQEAVDKYPGDPKSQLKEMGCAYIKFFVENPKYLRLIFLSDIKKKINNSCENTDDCDCFTDRQSYVQPFEILYRAAERYKAEAPGFGAFPSAPRMTWSRSLSVYREKYKPEYSIRISAKNFGFENGIKSVPLYAVFLI